jgi:hypothetical protein
MGISGILGTTYIRGRVGPRSDLDMYFEMKKNKEEEEEEGEEKKNKFETVIISNASHHISPLI